MNETTLIDYPEIEQASIFNIDTIKQYFQQKKPDKDEFII